MKLVFCLLSSGHPLPKLIVTCQNSVTHIQVLGLPVLISLFFFFFLFPLKSNNYVSMELAGKRDRERNPNNILMLYVVVGSSWNRGDICVCLKYVCVCDIATHSWEWPG